MNYFIYLNGNTIGPMTADQVVAYPVDANTQVSADGGAWQALYTYPELMALLHKRSAADPCPPTPDIEGNVGDKKTLFGILALLIGCLGIQYFTIGKTTAGLLTILISFLTCGAWGFVMFVQGIIVLTMNNEDFSRKFLNSTSTFPLF